MRGDTAAGRGARFTRPPTAACVGARGDRRPDLICGNREGPLFGWHGGNWRPIDIGSALESWGLGTGAAVADLDGDGRLELLIAHGESAEQPLSHRETADLGNN